MLDRSGIFSDWSLFFGSNFLKIFFQAFGEINGNKPSATNNNPINFKNTSTNYYLLDPRRYLKKSELASRTIISSLPSKLFL